MSSLLHILRTATFLFAALCVLASTGCQTTTRHKTSFQFDPPVTPPKNPENVKLYLSTGAQRLYVVEGNQVLLATPVSVGKASSPTPHGNFKIYSKIEKRRRLSEPGSGYPMTYWMEFKPAYGLHWGFIKPYPSTLGCVRLPLKAARKVFDLVRPGTPINISTSQPWDATIGKSLPVLDDSPLPNPPMSYMLSPQVFADARRGKLWNF
jgi:lipoprotein-anchoring transpeptidase ErfK/SrfK